MQKGGRRGSCGLSDLSEAFMRTVLTFRKIHVECPIVSEWTIRLSARSGTTQCLARSDSRGLSERSELFMRTVLSFRLIHADCPIMRVLERATTHTIIRQRHRFEQSCRPTNHCHTPNSPESIKYRSIPIKSIHLSINLTRSTFAPLLNEKRR